ncbi:MAG: EfeM/EfeO family lipoprotein [Planctomycetota bacterium]
MQVHGKTQFNRRQVLAGAIAAGITVPTLSGIAKASHSTLAQEDSPELASAVRGGVSYFAKRCRDQLTLCEDLERAIDSRELAAAQRAYIDSRPPYEEIETLAYAFEDSDRDIDARPYAFDGGETDREFRGFHKIEVLLFGHEDVAAAAPYASMLTASIRRLATELAEPNRFDAAGQFGGMIALANEVSSKKISSEEETWSDQTLLIFRHNWIGIYSQFEPFRDLVERTQAGAANKVSEAGAAALSLLKPHFGDGAAGTPYSRIGMSERRRMADASLRFRDTLIDAANLLRLDV